MSSEISYDVFRAQLHEADLALCAELDVPLPTIPGSPHFRATGWFGAIAVAGEALRLDPDKLLLPDTVPEGIIDPSAGALENTLKFIINASVTPPEPEADSWIVNGKAVPRVDTCGTAEYYFQETFKAMELDDPAESLDTSGWDYIATDEGEVIALQKRKGEQSVLSFVPVIIHDIPYPPGSILAATTEGLPRPGREENSVIPATAVDGLSFMRQSLYGLNGDDLTRILAGYTQRTKFETAPYMSGLQDLDIARAIAQAAYERHV